MGDDPSILDEETNREIQKMRSVVYCASVPYNYGIMSLVTSNAWCTAVVCFT